MITGTTTDYSGRLVDIEILNTVDGPSANKSLHLSLTPGRIVTGIQKAVQRYTCLFLTYDLKFDPGIGSVFIPAIAQGVVVSYADLYKLFSISNSLVLDQLSKTSTGMPDDERVASATLTDATLNRGSSTISLTIKITTVAGDSASFVIPTSIVKV